MLPRLHLFEIEDQAWCPQWLRRIMTGYLRVVNQRVHPYRAAAKPMADLLRDARTESICDLCSGAGGPWPSLLDDLAANGVEAKVLCTDLYPNPDAAQLIERHDSVRYHRSPVSALDVPEDLPGVRTLFTALHHFRPGTVRAMLEDAQAKQRPFAAFEVTHRSFKGVLAIAVAPIMSLFMLPLVRPRRPLPLLLSYLPPLVPAAIGWDGMVSTFRTYRASELRAMVHSLPDEGFEWRVGELDSGTPVPITYITGQPRGGSATPGRSNPAAG